MFVLTVTGLTALLNRTTTVLFTGTFWVPFAGVKALTTSGPVSVAAVPVVNVLPNGSTRLPATSAKPPTNTV